MTLLTFVDFAGEALDPTGALGEGEGGSSGGESMNPLTLIGESESPSASGEALNHCRS